MKSTAENILPLSNPQGTDEEMLLRLQQETFAYFIKEVNPDNGLVADKTEPGAPCSIAAVGFAISSYIVGIERGFMTREDGISRILTVLRFFANSHHGPEPDATGYKGLYYHFLDMKTGKRAWQSELSTIDTAFLIAGILTAANYFTGDSKEEQEIRDLGDAMYKRVDWQWALNNGTTLSHGWKPESGFLPYRWNYGYSEALLLYILALSSPTHPIGKEGYDEWQSTFEWKKVYDIEYLYAGPLFIHQFSHIWLDFRGIHDDFNRKHSTDYFENSHRATRVQQQYAIENPKRFPRYGKNVWGFTASDGPGPATLEVNGELRQFYNYTARGCPFGPDDGTVSPWAIVASLPFAPDIVLDTLRHFIERLNLMRRSDNGLYASFNTLYPERNSHMHGWVSPWRFGINQGPIVLMIENFQSELIWNIIKKCPHIKEGLRRAGFKGGWLSA
ncbi:MAG: hypothetical protein JSS96_11525 [Bacteroidetes bacterium]|nr:hypothetical protein [Bacteroidota bacterium]